MTDDAALLFRSCDDLDHGRLEILLRDRRFAAAGGKQRAFVQKVRKIRAGEACGRLGNSGQIDGIGQRLFACMHLPT